MWTEGCCAGRCSRRGRGFHACRVNLGSAAETINSAERRGDEQEKALRVRLACMWLSELRARSGGGRLQRGGDSALETIFSSLQPCTERCKACRSRRLQQSAHGGAGPLLSRRRAHPADRWAWAILRVDRAELFLSRSWQALGVVL